MSIVIILATVFLCSGVIAIALLTKGNREFGPDMSDWSPLCSIGSGAAVSTTIVAAISALIILLPTPH